MLQPLILFPPIYVHTPGSGEIFSTYIVAHVHVKYSIVGGKCHETIHLYLVCACFSCVYHVQVCSFFALACPDRAVFRIPHILYMYMYAHVLSIMVASRHRLPLPLPLPPGGQYLFNGLLTLILLINITL